MTSNRRPLEVSVHDWHHSLIEERIAAWRSAPRRSGLDRHRRREAEKRAYWTLTSHLGSHHGRRALNAFFTLDDAVALHATYHVDDCENHR